MFDVIRIPALKDNYIWLLRKDASAVVVDPGDADPVLRFLDQEGLTLSSILVTHHHNDHQGGVEKLLEHYPADVFGPAREFITGISRPLLGGETMGLPALDIEIKVIAVPGHTLGHLAYYLNGCLFSGDTLFSGGCGRLFEGTPAQMHDSLARLSSLPDNTLVYCAHEYTEANLRFAMAVESGNRRLRNRLDEVIVARAKGLPTVPSTIAIEKSTNPFLRCNEPAVIEAAQARDAQAHDPVAVFSVIREWKNSF